MSTLNLLTATLDDMVFEGRNKAYGAFVLRRLYNRHLTKAITTASAVCLLLVGVPFIAEHIWPTAFVIPPTIEDQGFEVIDVTLPKISEPIAPAPRAHTQPVVVTPHPTETIPVVVLDPKVIPPTKDLPLPEETVGAVEIGPVGEGVDSGGSIDGKGAATIGASDSGTAVVSPPSTPFSYAEVMPTFVGGEEALGKYLQHNMHYPPEALRNGISGKVYVSFVVNSTGAITNVEVVKGLGHGTDEEAMRVIRAMPAWIPGRQNHRTVAVRYTLPITFRYE